MFKSVQRQLLYVIALILSVLPLISYSKAPARIVIILDCAQSMQQQWNRTISRYSTASSFAIQLIDSAYNQDPTIEFALWAVGHQYSDQFQNCRDIKQEVYFSGNNREQMLMRMEHLHPNGISNIKNAIEIVVSNIDQSDKHSYKIVVLTDGSIGCEKDLCSKLNNKTLSSSIPIHLVTLANPVSDINCFKNALTIKDMVNIPAAINAILEGFKINQQPKIAQIPSSQDDYAFGYLLITDDGGNSISDLQYKNGNSYMPLTKLSISSVKRGQKIMLKNGDYLLQYSKDGKILEKRFTIAGAKTTEVSIL